MRFLSFASVFCVLALIGCATTGIDRSRKTSSDMQQARADVASCTVKLDEVMSAWTAMNAAKDQKGLTGSFSTWRSKLASARNAVQLVSQRADAMRANGDAYFDEWEKESTQITNEDIRTLSNERRKELQGKFKEVSASFITVKEADHLILSDLNDMERHLSNDLNPDSVKALAPVADKLKGKVEQVRGESTALTGKIDALVARMNPTDVKSK